MGIVTRATVNLIPKSVSQNVKAIMNAKMEIFVKKAIAHCHFVKKRRIVNLRIGGTQFVKINYVTT